MASIKPGPLVTKIRGSVAGVCFGAGPGGDTARRKSKPKWPWGLLQMQTQRYLRQAAQTWQTLTAETRNDWADYAATVDLTNRLGDTFHPTGANMFVRSGVFQMFYSGSISEEAAPATTGLPIIPVPTLDIDSGDLRVASWEVEPLTDDLLLLNIYRPQSRLGGPVARYLSQFHEHGPGVPPITIQAGILGSWPVGSILRIWVSVQVRDVDGLTSGRSWVSLDHTVT